VIVEKQIVVVQVHRHVERQLGDRDAGDVVDVRVRQQNVLDVEVMVADRTEQLVHLVSGIDDDRLAGTRTADDEPVLVKRRLGPHFDDHSTYNRIQVELPSHHDYLRH
jgi:hypothetical protein